MSLLLLFAGGFYGPIVAPTADVTVQVRQDVGVIEVRPDVGTIQVRPDVGDVEP